MAKFLVFVVALFALQGCLAKPRAEAPAAGKIEIQKLAENVEGFAKKFAEQVGLPELDSKTITASVTDNTNKLIESIQSVVGKIKDEGKAHEGEVNSALATLQEKLSTAAADLQKAAGPDATKRAEEAKTEFNKAYKTVADQYQQFVKTYEPEVKGAGQNIEKISKNFLESLQTIGKSLQENIDKAVQEHEKTHKH